MKRVISRLMLRLPALGLLSASGLILGSGCATRREAPTPPPVTGPVAAKEPVFFPAPPVEPRIQFLTTLNDNAQFRPPPKPRAERTFMDFLAGGEVLRTEPEQEPIKEIGKPYGVAMHDGTIFVADTLYGVVHAYDFPTRSYTSLGARGRGALKKPNSLYVAPDGTRYVADPGRGQVVVFDSSNEFLRALGDDESCRPVACVVAGKNLFVVDAKDREIERRDVESGQLLGTFGERNPEDSGLFTPTNIAVDAQGQLYVTDTINCRVQIYSQDGERLNDFGGLGDRLGQFARPKGIAVSPDGLIYVVDAAFENVQIFGPHPEGGATPALYLVFGGPGNQLGNMYLPAGIAISADGLRYLKDYVAPEFEAEYVIVVINQFGPFRVSVYAKGQLKEK